MSSYPVNSTVIRVPINTSTGIQTITDANFLGTPKAAIFMLSRNTSDGVAADGASMSYGTATAVDEQWVVAASSEHGVGTTDTSSYASKSRCLVVMNPTTGLVQADATFNSFVENGVRINWNVASGSAYLLTVVMFGGTSLQARSGVKLVDTGLSEQANFVEVGFEPDVVFGGGANTDLASSFNGVESSGANISIGFAHNAFGQRRGNGFIGSLDGVSSSDVGSRTSVGDHNEELVFLSIDGTGYFSIPSFTSSGFNTDVSSNSKEFGYLVLSFGNSADVWLGDFDSTTSTGIDYQSIPNFIPQVAFVLPKIYQGKSNNADAASTLSISIMGKSASSSISFTDNDGEATTDTQSLSDSKAMLYPSHDGTILYDATFNDFTQTGWEWNFTTSESTSYKWVALVIEETEIVLTDIGDKCNCPTITYPNGREEIFGTEMTITWNRPVPTHQNNDPAWYELFFTDSYQEGRRVNWMNFAVVTGDQDSFTWTLPPALKSRGIDPNSDLSIEHGPINKRFRIGIRCRDHRGVRGEMSISADDFTIQPKRLTFPAVISPVQGQTYRFNVPIVIDNSAIIGTYSQRAFYQAFYSSESNNIDWTLINQNIPVGSDPVLWDVQNLPAANDYRLMVVMADNDGNTSVPVYIEDINISPINNFIIDTTPPKGTVRVDNNSEYTKDKNIVLALNAFDDATGVSSLKIQQREDGLLVAESPNQDFSNRKTWFLSGNDGVKFVEALYKDVVGNVASTGDNLRSFRTFINSTTDEVTAVLVQKNGDLIDVWTAFGGSSPSLFRNQTLFLNLDYDATAIAGYNDVIYLTLKDSTNKGILQKVNNQSISTITTFTSDDSFINSMAASEDILYMGMHNGDLYSYNGSSTTFISNRGNEIVSLYSDNALLYVFLRHSDSIEVYDGSSFTTLGSIDGNHQV
jgi:hypothetical protein